MIGAWGAATLAVVGICVVLFGMSKTAMPVAGVLAGPLLAATLGASRAAGLAVPLLIAGDLIALGYYRQGVDWRLLRRLAPGVLLGLTAAALLFWLLPVPALNRTVGALVLTSFGLELWRRRRGSDTQPQTRTAPALFFGSLAGTTTMTANAGGTALTLYLVMLRVPILTFMGTSAWFFFFLNLVKVPFIVALHLVTRQSLDADLVLLPLLASGAWFGNVLVRAMEERAFTQIALALSGAFALWLVLHG